MLAAMGGQLLWAELALQFGLLCMAALASFVIGVIKHFEPSISLKFNDEKLQYFHRYGQWSVKWNNVNRIYIPVFHYGLEHRKINYIGIKLIELEELIDHFSPRLASRIIHEHRDILALSISQGDATTELVQVNFNPFVFDSGYQVNGPIAACLHQMILLEKLYGAHLFIPISVLDKAPDEVLNLLIKSKKAINN